MSGPKTCKCGCGGPTKGDYVRGHWARTAEAKAMYEGRRLSKLEPPNPSGLCMCGCGEKTSRAETTSSKDGVAAGEYRRFKVGHHARWAAGHPSLEDRKARKRAYNRRYYKANREELRTKQAEYDKANADQIRRRHRKNRMANHAAILEADRLRGRDYYQRKKAEDPTYYAEQRSRRRAREAAAAEDTVDLEAILRDHGNICHICSRDIPDGQLEFDHVIPISRGGPHTAENIRPSHIFCNRSKGTRLLEEMVA